MQDTCLPSPGLSNRGPEMSTRTERKLLADATSSEAEKGHVCRLGLGKQPTASAKIQNGRRMYLAVGLHLGSALAATLVSAGTASIFAEKFAMPKTVKGYAKCKLPPPRLMSVL